MAEDETTADGIEGGGANEPSRSDVIINGFASRYAKDKQIEAQVKKHVTPFKDDLAKIRKDMKNDLNVNSTDLNLQYALYKRKREAREFMDDDEGQGVLDDLQMVMFALDGEE